MIPILARMAAILHRINSKFSTEISEREDEYPELREIPDKELEDFCRTHQRRHIVKSKDGIDDSLARTILDGKKMVNISFGEADLSYSSFRRADLEGADFSKTLLYCTDLRESNLQDADLSESRYLLCNQLAGADLRGAVLPQDISKFDSLHNIGELAIISKNLLGMLALMCLYAWLAIATTTDLMLVINSPTLPLPIIGSSVPIYAFYIFVPILLIGLYVYFLVHLQRLWEMLGDLPAVFPDGTFLDEKAFPWIIIGFVQRNSHILRKERPYFSMLQSAIIMLLLWGIVPLTVFALALRYRISHNGTAFWLHLVLVSLCICLSLSSCYLSVRTLRLKDQEFFGRGRPSGGGAVIFLGLFEIVGLLVLLVYWIVGSPSAYLSGMEISTKPPNWDGNLYDVAGASLRNKDLRDADISKSFLFAADLRGADLRNTNLAYADLRHVDFSGAQLNGADVNNADLQYSIGLDSSIITGLRNWRFAYFDGAQTSPLGLPPDHNERLGTKNFENADLSVMEIYRMDLRYANLRSANLANTFLTGVDFGNADLTGATLTGAIFGYSKGPCRMANAKLEKTNLKGANLTGIPDLSVDQINVAIIDAGTELPEYIINLLRADSSTYFPKYPFIFSTKKQ